MHRLLTALLLIATVTASAWADATRVAIGVLVGDGERSALARWTPTADYLAQKIPEHRFVIVPLDREAMRQALERRQLDFVLTDPGHYVKLGASHGIDALATLKHRWQGKPYSVFGAVIFARQDRDDIDRINDLSGKSFMADDPDAIEFVLVCREFKAHGLNPFKDCSQLFFRNLSHDQIVYAVRDGAVDAGTVRTGVLERLAEEGRISLGDFRVLHPRGTSGFPFVHSTDLVPEWAFARSHHVPDLLAQQVAAALLTMPENHPAAVSGRYAGWSIPLDYRPVQALLNDAKASPYAQENSALLAETIRRYRPWLIAGLLALLAMMTATFHILRLNRRLTHAKRSLEREMGVRRNVEETLRQSEEALRGLHRITSAQDLDFHGKLQALLAMGCQRFCLPIGILSRVEGENYEIVEAVAPDGTIAKGMVFPVSQTYCCNTLHSEEPVGFEHAAASEWATHPAYRAHKLEAYLGIRVEVESAVYGTLNFISPSPRTVRFTNTDREILKLMAQWVAGEIQRQRTAAHALKLSSALEQTADVVVITDREGGIEYVNPAFQQITGYTREEVSGKTPRFLRSGQHGKEFYRRLWETILRGEVFHGTFINRRKDGSLYYEGKTITPLKDSRGSVVNFVSTGKDMTQHRLAEEQTRQHQAQLAHVCRVSAMGEMAAALAHELNQPLAAIVNYAQGGIHRLRAGEMNRDELLEALEHIAAQGHQSGEIIRRLRSFLRRGNPQRKYTDVNRVVREAVELADLEARQKEVTLRLDLSDDLPPVLADMIQIEQVVLNLLHNAIEAIDDARWPKREVTVRTSVTPNGRVEVTVCDTGPGLPAENADRLFEAFFTTKPDGMGMGLSISRSIVEAHGDQLQAMINPDGGAAFRFSLSVKDQRTAR